MIDVENYNRAIQWLQRSLAELSHTPDNPVVQLGALHCIEVTYNISERILREVYVLLGNDEQTPYISARELVRRAGEDGLVLSTPKQWMQYGFALEAMRETCMLSLAASPEELANLGAQLIEELRSFARCLDVRLAASA